MLWSIDERDPSPLHEQIARSIRLAATDGSLVAGERLPTSNELAAVLGVNPNTVLRAYRDLRRDGLLEFRRGRGVHLSSNFSTRAALVDAARQFLSVGRAHGYNPGALAVLLQQLEPE